MGLTLEKKMYEFIISFFTDFIIFLAGVLYVSVVSVILIWWIRSFED
tara:strand:+ start:436 stop:576 length:141 start_codon:yes stop_codon:yes gene_type:complete